MQGHDDIPRVDAGADTVHWGFFDAKLKPVLTVDSGDRVVMSSVSGAPDQLPPSPFMVPPALPAIHAANGPQHSSATCAPARWRSAAPCPGRSCRSISSPSSYTTTGATTSSGR